MSIFLNNMRLPILFLLFLLGFPLFSQEGIVRIDSISVEGNKKTHRAIILRELPFQSGDTIPLAALSGVLEEGERWLMNTGLFNRVDIFFRNWEGSANRVHLQVEVEESWYFYPIPVFELADRNFNVWWVDQKRSLARTNYGIDFKHRNTTGRRDRLNVVVKAGYTQLFLTNYTLPYFNRSKTWGLSWYSLFARNREINYATIGNRQAFYKSDDHFALNRFTTQFSLIHRPKLNQQHYVQLGFFQNQVLEKVSEELNPGYFLNEKNRQRFFSLSYQYIFDERDIRPYPLSGVYFSTELEKDGLGVFSDRNGLTWYGDFRRYIPLGKGPFYAAVLAKGKYSLIREPQPYNDNRAIGFQDYTLHGYEYYVIDGPDMVMINTSLRLKLWDDQINFGKLMPFTSFRKMPLKVFFALNGDGGYVNNPWNVYNNSFNNRWLMGGGVGLEVVFFFDFVLRIEGSVNHLREPGLYLHFNTSI